MVNHSINTSATPAFRITRTLLFLTPLLALLFANSIVAQNTSPEGEGSFGNYEISSTLELGVRGLKLEGDEDKFRSDHNYKSGFRLFDSSFSIRPKAGHKTFFDSFIVNTSGFGADRNGFAKLTVEKSGIYRLDGNVRRISFFSDAANIARGARGRNTSHYLTDFDVSVTPWGDKVTLMAGISADSNRGPGTWTIRGFRSNASDEWKVDVNNNTQARDYRAGIAADLAGFALSLQHGYRGFRDDTIYSITSLNQGFNPNNTSSISSFQRDMPVRGGSHYTQFSGQRTFADRLDLAARLIYATSKTKSQMSELITGRDSQNNFVDLDRFDAQGDTKRIEKRGDVGLTFFVTDKFKISNTYMFDTFGIDGGGAFWAATTRRSATGIAQVVAPANSTAFRLTDYKRQLNTIEADYQFSSRAAFHIGYRYSHRRVTIERIDTTLTSAPSPTNPAFHEETESNATHSGIAGVKIVPVKNWVFYADAEVGEADNAFTRLSNYKFVNFRARSRWNFSKFSLNLSAFSRDNENPSISTAPQSPSNPTTGGVFINNTKNRTFAGNLDWTPVSELTLSVGYTYQWLTAETDIVINAGSGLQRGVSSYFMRNHFAFLDISARPTKWFSLYASYRNDLDRGQGDRYATTPNFIISSYPYRMTLPEARAAFRITRNIDWVVGYQYYRYGEDILNTMPPRYPPFTITTGTNPPLLLTDVPAPQNYRAHLPYTALRIYFGRSAEDR